MNKNYVSCLLGQYRRDFVKVNPGKTCWVTDELLYKTPQSRFDKVTDHKFRLSRLVFDKFTDEFGTDDHIYEFLRWYNATKHDQFLTTPMMEEIDRILARKGRVEELYNGGAEADPQLRAALAAANAENRKIGADIDNIRVELKSATDKAVGDDLAYHALADELAAERARNARLEEQRAAATEEMSRELAAKKEENALLEASVTELEQKFVQVGLDNDQLQIEKDQIQAENDNLRRRIRVLSAARNSDAASSADGVSSAGTKETDKGQGASADDKKKRTDSSTGGRGDRDGGASDDRGAHATDRKKRTTAEEDDKDYGSGWRESKKSKKETSDVVENIASFVARSTNAVNAAANCLTESFGLGRLLPENRKRCVEMGDGPDGRSAKTSRH